MNLHAEPSAERRHASRHALAAPPADPGAVWWREQLTAGEERAALASPGPCGTPEGEPTERNGGVMSGSASMTQVMT